MAKNRRSDGGDGSFEYGDRRGKIEAEWLGLKQVTEYACVSERTLRGWIHSRVDALPAVRVAGKILVRRSELDVWLGRHRVKPLESVDLDTIVKDTLREFRFGS